MLHVFFEMLHWIAAGAFAFVGLEYDRVPECNPVALEPALVQTAYIETTPGSGDVFVVHNGQVIRLTGFEVTSGCGRPTAPRAVQRPALPPMSL